MNLTLKFRTVVEDGLILWSGSRHSGDFLALSLVHGTVHYRFDLGGGEVLVIYNGTNLADGAWHRVEIRRHDQWGQLRLDGGAPQSRIAPGKLTQLNTNSGLYIGKQCFPSRC